MTPRIEKTVFISYRRTNGIWARAIYQDLTMHGYDAFFDFQSINSGDFSQVILENIKARAHFVLLLTPSALERCDNPDDWLRKEIETAIEFKRNIVPLMLESFDFGSPSISKYLSGKLSLLKNYNGLRIHSDYFEEGMIRLKERYLNISLDAVLHPVSSAVHQETQKQKEIADNAPEVSKQELTAQEWYERGYAYWEEENRDEAIRCSTEAISLDPEFSRAFALRGAVRFYVNDFDGSLKDLDEAIRIGPKTPENAFYYFVRGNTHIAKGNLEKAMNDYEEAIGINPDDADFYYARGNVHKIRNDLQDALADYNEAIRINPDDAPAYTSRGVIFQMKGETEFAIADFSRAIQIKPEALTYNNRGYARRINSDLNGALSDAKEAIHLNPDYLLARMNLFSLLLKFGKDLEAKEHEQFIRQSLSKLNEYNQACFEAICGNTDKALELLKISLEKKQWSKQWASREPNFENIRDDLRFKELVGE